MEQIDFEAITVSKEISSRRSYIEINLTTLGFNGMRMIAYQNYLGGGILGRVTSDCNVPDWRNNEKVSEISEQLKEHLFYITSPDEESFEHQSYVVNQHLPISGY